jgi:hypothetical protein
MARLNSDELHNHQTWGPILRPEYVELGRLHRHRINDPLSVPRFTTWERNTRSHRHRLPDGAWSRPRLELLPAEEGAVEQRPSPPTRRTRRSTPPATEAPPTAKQAQRSAPTV